MAGSRNSAVSWHRIVLDSVSGIWRGQPGSDDVCSDDLSAVDRPGFIHESVHDHYRRTKAEIHNGKASVSAGVPQKYSAFSTEKAVSDGVAPGDGAACGAVCGNRDCIQKVGITQSAVPDSAGNAGAGGYERADRCYFRHVCKDFEIIVILAKCIKIELEFWMRLRD